MWFLDTGYLIALFSEKDTYHRKALDLRALAQSSGRTLVTTDAVLFEIGAAFSRVAFRSLGAQLIETLQTDPLVEIMALTTDSKRQALALFADRPDKDWSLCDCLSFVVMQERGMREALTPDHHFTQAGFSALLLRDSLELESNRI